MRHTPRRFGLLDAVILVAAVATGIAWSRFLAAIPGEVASPFVPYDPYRSSLPEGVTFAIRQVWEALTLIAPCGATATIGVLLVRLRRPRPDRRRLLAQPGTTACLAIAHVLALAWLRVGIDLLRWVDAARLDSAGGAVPASPWWWALYEVLQPREPGLAVSAVWLVQGMSGRMRCERSAIDRLGRALGCFWIGTMVFSWLAAGTTW